MYLPGSLNTAKGGGLWGNLVSLSKTNTVRIALVSVFFFWILGYCWWILQQVLAVGGGLVGYTVVS